MRIAICDDSEIQIDIFMHRINNFLKRNGECGIFTEILVDGHKLEGVRSFELKQGVGDSEPILSIDLNALNLSTDLQMLQVNQKGIGEIEGIKFKDSPRMLKFQTE